MASGKLKQVTALMLIERDLIHSEIDFCLDKQFLLIWLFGLSSKVRNSNLERVLSELSIMTRIDVDK